MRISVNSGFVQAIILAGVVNTATFSSIALAQELTKATETATEADMSQSQQYTISAGPLSRVLSEFAAQAGILLSVDGQLTQGKDSAGLNGKYPVKQALHILLAETGLSAKFTESGAVTLERLVIGKSVLPEITVIGHEIARYIVTEAPSTTRSNVPIMETSRSIQIIGRDFMDDANVQSLEDALKYVSGVAPRQRLGGIDTQYYVRGFRRTYTFRNGKRDKSESRVNMDTVETVEVLKGPSSVRFGVNAPGGIVNYTTKKPQAKTARSFQVSVDEHGQRKIIGDLTGAANKSGTVLYRVILAGENSETFRDFSDTKTMTVAPSLTFLLSDKTKLTTAYERHYARLPIDRGIPFGQLSDGSYEIADVPIGRRIGEPDDHSEDNIEAFDVALHHQFSNSWQGELSYSYQNWSSSWSDVQQRGYFPEATMVGGVLLPAGTVIRSRSGYINKEKNTHQVSALLHGDFELAGIQHKMTFGADYSNTDIQATWGEGAVQPSTDIPSIFNIFNPVYGEFPTGLTPVADEDESTDTKGIFVNETAYLGDSLIVNLAARYDYYDHVVFATDGWEHEEKDEALTWNAGLLYKIAPVASIYLSYATSYEPNSANRLVGELKPQEGEQWEIGVKGLAMNDTLQYSLVYYDITKSNIPNRFRDPNGDWFVKLIGEQTSEGIELDINWQVTNDFSFLASYAYIDAVISKNEADPEVVGNTPEGIPKQSAALFASYELTSLVPNLTVMGGFNYAAEVPNDEDNTFMVPGATTFNLAVKYNVLAGDGNILLQAGIKNLTDERVYIQNGWDSVGIGRPRTIYAIVKYRF